MFYPEKIKSIKDSDYVLEIGPGGHPHERSDIFLDIDPKKFKSKKIEKMQRGEAPKLKTNKKVIYYDGYNMPFKDNEFDYVICSHVLEHVDDVPLFIKELQRISKMGYIEFPTIFYEYLYNFLVHKQLLNYDSKTNTILYMSKKDANMDYFLSVQSIFLKTLELGKVELVGFMKNMMFQGFEWKDKIKFKKIDKISSITPKGRFSYPDPESQSNNIKASIHKRMLRKIKVNLKRIVG
jgi:ubiquinone/menaquinone biosynthesis C-methylase UbiE